jgi:alpha-amylase
MARLTLLLGLHNHQPVGNFGHVFAQAYDDCYRRVIDLLTESPAVRLSLHHTGPLLEWLEGERPDYLERTRALVQRGQVELLGGGFYEPMLAVLPERDALGQIRLMADWCETKLGARPRGMWLAERVWEPHLPLLLHRAGVAYTLVDDGHFRYAGVEGELRGYYSTEKAGAPLALFPIDKSLRYAIPFSEPARFAQLFDELATRTPAGLPAVVTYGDDGEKFGLWPHTRQWVWDKGWLRSLFRYLTDHQDTIRCATFSDVMREVPPSGRVYLPAASYEEMGEWALPAGAQQRYHEVRSALEHRGELEGARPFLRGGIWQNFLAKYPEADFMHKKMVRVSNKLDAVCTALGEAPSGADRSVVDAARLHLYRGQCNCAYWHGLFGGLYLNYLRDAVYRNLIAAEVLVDGLAPASTTPSDAVTVEVLDLDADLSDEVELRSAGLTVYVKPSLGGALYELDDRKTRFNLLNVLGSRPEAYHAKLIAHDRGLSATSSGEPTPASSDRPRSIHDLVQVKEAGLSDLLRYDRHLRLGFVDHLLSILDFDAFQRGTYDECGDFAGKPYTLVSTHGGAVGSAVMSRTAAVSSASGTVCLRIDKTISLLGDGQGRTLTCSWRLTRADEAAPAGGATPLPTLEVWFVPELTLTLLAGDAEDRHYHVAERALPPSEQGLGSRGVLRDIAGLELWDGWQRLAVRLEPGDHFEELWRLPLETVSQSEGGFERVYQGCVVAPVFRVSLRPTQSMTTHVTVRLFDR